MTAAAQKYMLHYLQKKYSLTKEQMTQIEKYFTEQTTDDFLFQTQLESAGIDESTAQRTVKIADILRKIRFYINPADRETEEKAPVLPTKKYRPAKNPLNTRKCRLFRVSENRTTRRPVHL